MHDPAVTVCFGLFLEAYCRGAQDHIPVLSQQVEALKKLSCVTELMRQDAVTKNENKENQLKYLQKVLSFHKNSFINLRCTLEPRIIFGSLKVSLLSLTIPNSDLTLRRLRNAKQWTPK